MHLLRGSTRLALMAVALLLALTVTAPAVSVAQDAQPQCSDGVDNDSDNAIDGADAGCADGSDDDETDSPLSGIKFITVPLPVVTLQGTVDRKGVVDVARLVIRAQRGSKVTLTCRGAKCPFKTIVRRMITTTLRLGKAEGRLRPRLRLTMRITRPGQLGKYMTYTVRKRKAPVRSDACLDQTTGAVKGCFD